jgi:hypothetical protein
MLKKTGSITIIKYEVDFRFTDFTNKQFIGSLIDGFSLFVTFHFTKNLEQQLIQPVKVGPHRLQIKEPKVKFENVRFKSNKKISCLKGCNKHSI